MPSDGIHGHLDNRHQFARLRCSTTPATAITQTRDRRQQGDDRAPATRSLRQEHQHQHPEKRNVDGPGQHSQSERSAIDKR